MHTTIMSDRLALDLGRNSMSHIENYKERGCNHCGYNIPNGEIVFLESWTSLDVLKGRKSKIHLQWKAYHPLCVAQRALFTVGKTIPNFQTLENDPTYEG